MSATYWYSTNGMDHKRLSNRHTRLLDEAYERRIRVEIYDIEAFGPSVVAVANPFAGTMTAGDIHYGLYRNPSLALHDASSSSLDTLILLDTDNLLLKTSPSSPTTATKTDSDEHYHKSVLSSSTLRSESITQTKSENHRRALQNNIHPPFTEPSNCNYRFTHTRRSPPPPPGDNHCVCCVIS